MPKALKKKSDYVSLYKPSLSSVNYFSYTSTPRVENSTTADWVKVFPVQPCMAGFFFQASVCMCRASTVLDPLNFISIS